MSWWIEHCTAGETVWGTGHCSEDGPLTKSGPYTSEEEARKAWAKIAPNWQTLTGRGIFDDSVCHACKRPFLQGGK